MFCFRAKILWFATLAFAALAGETQHAAAQERLVLEQVKVASLAFAPDGKVLALGYLDGKVALLDPATGKERGRLSGHTECVKFLAFSPDGKTLASAGQDNTVRLWDVAKRKVKAVMKGHEGGPMCVAFSPDGKLLASAGGADNTVRLWDTATGLERKVFKRHTDFVYSAVFVQGGKTVVSVSAIPYEDAVKIWDAATAQERKSFQGHQAGIACLAAAPDGKSFATGSHDESVKLWDVANAKNTKILKGEGDTVFSLAYSSDGKLLASGHRNGKVTIWEVATGRQRTVVDAHYGTIVSLSFDPQARTLATAGADDTVKIWDVAKLLEQKENNGKTDPERIHGAWKVVLAKATAGFDDNTDVVEYKDSVWTFGKKEITIKKGKAETKYAYVLDPAKKPKQIDFGKDLNGKNLSRPFEGIYKLDGDRLVICYIVFNGRPADFTMPIGIQVEKVLVVLERRKR